MIIYMMINHQAHGLMHVVPRNPNFNPTKLSKTASYWKHFHQLNETEINQVDRAYQKRLQSLQSVDEMIESLVKELDAQGKLNNTYIFFSSDNG